MTAPTHTSFSLLFILLLGLLIGLSFNPTIAVLAIIGALLPDLDTPKSAIGRLLRPLAVWLERKYGHRQATHSLLALGLLALVSAPLIELKLFWWLALLSGYLSHLILDATNKSGVPLFFPNPIRAVMPKAAKYRLACGCKAEMVLFTVVSLTACLLLPVNRIGLFKSLHYVLRDTNSAISDYRCWADDYRVYADVKGVFNLSQQAIQSQFEVVGISNLNSLVVYDFRADLIYTVGSDKNANIYPTSIRCIKGEAIDVVTKKVTLKNQLLGTLINHIPTSGRTFIKGSVSTLDQVILPRDPESYETIRPSKTKLELRYAMLKELQDINLSTIFAISGDLYLRTILPASNHNLLSDNHNPVSQADFNPNLTPVSMSTNRVYTVQMYLNDIRHLSELLVSEGQDIKAGDVVAKLHDNNEATLALEEAKLKRQIQTLQSEASETSSLFVTAARIRLAEIQQQRDKHLIASAFNAKVLLIRVVAVHNNSLTIALKLLVNAPQTTPSQQPIPNRKPEPPFQPETPKNDNLLKAAL
jgi:inner membrane protein